MKNFQWNSKFLEEKKEALLILKKTNIIPFTDFKVDGHFRGSIEDSLDVYDAIRQILTGEISPKQFDDSFEVPMTDLEYLTYYFFDAFEKFDSRSREKVIPAASVISRIGFPSSNKFTRRIKNINLAQEELIALLDEFFKGVHNPELYDFFKEIKDPDNCLLNFQSALHNQDFSSATLVDTYHHISYGNVLLSGCITDFFDSVSEITRMFMRKNARAFYHVREERFLTELESYFMSFLAADFLVKKGFSKNEILALQFMDLEEAVYDCVSLLVANRGLVHIDDEECFDVSALKKDIFRTLGLKLYEVNDDTIRQFYDAESYLDSASVATSYLAALDLYRDYKIDPASTMEQLNEFRDYAFLPPSDAMERLGITFDRDNYQNFAKQLSRFNHYANMKKNTR